MQLIAQSLSAGYGEKQVLQEVQFALSTGEFVGLIGLNGCGKSTLLRVLSGVLPMKQGAVHLDGKPLNAWSPLERAQRLSFVPQQEPAHFDFSVRDVVLMGRYPHQKGRGVTQIDFERTTQALAQADIEHLADRSITELSGGEHRRVLLARALAQETPLLLMDEPTAHLDVTHQVEIMRLALSLVHESGRGVLAALHDLNQSAEFCDRLILMHAGRLVADGTPEAVLTPENLRLAYQAEAEIGVNPKTQRPMIFALRSLREAVEAFRS